MNRVSGSDKCRSKLVWAGALMVGVGAAGVTGLASSVVEFCEKFFQTFSSSQSAPSQNPPTASSASQMPPEIIEQLDEVERDRKNREAETQERKEWVEGMKKAASEEDQKNDEKLRLEKERLDSWQTQFGQSIKDSEDFLDRLEDQWSHFYHQGLPQSPAVRYNCSVLDRKGFHNETVLEKWSRSDFDPTCCNHVISMFGNKDNESGQPSQIACDIDRIVKNLQFAMHPDKQPAALKDLATHAFTLIEPAYRTLTLCLPPPDCLK